MFRSLLVAALLAHGAAVTPVAQPFMKAALKAAALQESAIPGVEIEYVEMAGSVKCIVGLMFVYFFFYSGVYFGKMFLDYMQTPRSAFMEILERGKKDVSLAPQLCVLFLACRLRAMYLKTEPTAWTQDMMMIASACICAQACFTVLMPCVSGEYSFGAEELKGVADGRQGIAGFVVFIRELLEIAVFVFALWIVADIIGMETKSGAAPPPVAPAVQCTIILTCAYFIAFGAYDGCRTVAEFMTKRVEGEDGGFASSTLKKISDIFSVGLETMYMAPMICVLFLAVRLRAMAMGLDGPQGWAQDAMYYTTAAMLVTSIMAVVGPLVFSGKLNKGLVDGDVTFEMDNWYVGLVFSIARYVCLFATWIGLIIVLYSTFVVEPASGHTKLAMSTAMQTTMILTNVYFTALSGFWVAVSVKQFVTGDNGTLAKWVDQLILMFDQMKATTGFIPMTTLLFMAARIRALRVVGMEGAPQNWVQYMMWVATIGLTLSALMAFFQPVLDYLEGISACAMVNNILRSLSLLSVHVGAVSIVVGIFLLTPENSGNLGLSDPFKVLKGGVADVTGEISR